MFKCPLSSAGMLFLALLACLSTAHGQSRIDVLDSISLPEEYLLNLQAQGSGYTGIASVRPEGSLCGGNSAWIELDSTGKTTRFVPLIRDNGKAVCAYQFFRRGDELYTFHENTYRLLLRWDKELRFVKEIPIQFPERGYQYDLNLETALPQPAPDGSLRLVCRAERLLRRRKDIESLGRLDWTGPSLAILHVSPDGKNVHATLHGGFPSYYREGFTYYRHHSPICLDPDGNIIQSFGMGGASRVYHPTGRLMDSLPCPTLPMPANERHTWLDKLHTLHFAALRDVYARLLYDAKSDHYLRVMVHAADQTTADSIEAAKDYAGMSRLLSQRVITIEVIQRNGFQTLATIPSPIKPMRILRTSGNDLWIHSGSHVYHCRIVLDGERL